MHARMAAPCTLREQRPSQGREWGLSGEGDGRVACGAVRHAFLECTDANGVSVGASNVRGRRTWCVPSVGRGC